MKHDYEVIVGNIGRVYEGHNKQESQKRFRFYVKDSKTGLGRSGNEPVYMMCDGECYEEYEPERDQEEDF